MDVSIPPEDALAIDQLYSRYNHAIHLGDGTAWAQCFTPNGVFSNQRETVTGRQSLTAYADEFSKLHNARYWVSNLLLEPADLGIRGNCYLLLLHVSAGAQPSIQLTGHYKDLLVPTLDGWRFATRHVSRDL